MHIRETRKPRMFRRLQRPPQPVRCYWAGMMLLIGFLFAGLPAIARADGAGNGLLLRDGDTWMPGLVMDTRVEMQVRGLLAEVTVTQTWVNADSDWREGRYLLPLPENAAVGALTLRIGERLIEGEIREKEEAQRVYAEAAASGRRAGLVAQDRPNLFQTAVANVGPGETVEIEVRYWQPVDFRDGVFSLSLPLTFTPRYTPAPSVGAPSGAMPPSPGTAPGGAPAVRIASGSSEISVIAPEGAPTGAAEGRGVMGSTLPPTFELVAEIEAGLPLAVVESPSHVVDVHESAGIHRVVLAHWVEGSDRDFVLRWAPVPSDAPRSALFTDRVHGEDFALLMLVPPTLPQAPLSRELVLVIDNSGSMEGASMRQAIEGADRALARLRPGDRFNVIRFDDSFDVLFPEAVPAEPGNVARARAFVRSLRAAGGTEMMPALRAAFAGQAPAGFLRQVVLVTDAAISNEDELLALVQSGRGESRLFPVGIGSAPNGHFLRKAAELGRGTHVVIRDIQEVSARMDELLAKLDRPAMRDIQLDWPAGADAYPQRVPDLYAGEALQVVAKLRAMDGHVTVRGLRPQPWVRQIELGDRAVIAPGVGRLWARARIDALEDQVRAGGELASLRPLIVDTALRHGLVSSYTSLVAVERTPARPQTAPLSTTRVNNASPEGSLAFAQGSLGWRAELLLAIALATLSALLLRSRG